MNGVVEDVNSILNIVSELFEFSVLLSIRFIVL